MAKWRSRDLLKTGINGSFNIDLEDVLSARPPFSALIADDTDRYYTDLDTRLDLCLYKYQKNHQHIEESTIKAINEATRKDILSGADIARKDRAKKVSTMYAGVTEEGYVKFITKSMSRPSIKHIQLIRLDDIKDIDSVKEFSGKEIANLLLNGNISLYCSCEDFKYGGYAYIATQLGYGINSEKREPNIRNPKLKGTICKHLIAVLTVLMFNQMKIYKDFSSSSYFKKIIKKSVRKNKKHFTGIGKFRKNNNNK